MNAISANYRELAPSEVDQVARECAGAWLDENVPMRQYELAAQQELEGYRNGKPCAPFDAFVKCIHRLPHDVLTSNPRLLDIGASGGYYSEVLRIVGVNVQYTGVDFSPAFKALANILYRGIDFDTADARSLPYHDDSFDIVLSGAVLMHVHDYAKAIQEAARVSRKYVIFHRTPVVPIERNTAFFVKDGYGCQMLEIHFSEIELYVLFRLYGLHPLYATDVFRNADDFSHRTYLLEKQRGLNHVQV